MPQFKVKITYKTPSSKKWKKKEKTFNMSYPEFEELSKKPTHLIIGILFKMTKGLIDYFELTEVR